MSDRWRPEWQHAGWCATRSRSYNDCDCGLATAIILPPPADPDARYVVRRGEVVGVLEMAGLEHGDDCEDRVMWPANCGCNVVTTYAVRPLPVEPEENR